MSTKAKGLCGLLTLLFSLAAMIVVLGLIPLYLKVAESSQNGRLLASLNNSLFQNLLFVTYNSS